jgi:hypothetical protein
MTWSAGSSPAVSAVEGIKNGVAPTQWTASPARATVSFMGGRSGLWRCWLRAVLWLALLSWLLSKGGTAPQPALPQKRNAADGNSKASDKTSNGPSLIAILGLIAPLATALGALALTGTVGRIQRNAEGRTEVAFILVVAASAIWGVGLLFAGPWTKWVRVVATAVAATGTIFALLAAITTAGRQARPQIDASLNAAHTELTATVKASSLDIEDRLAIVVDGLTSRARNEIPEPTRPSLYQAYVGPDQDGNVSQKIEVAVPAKDKYDSIGIKAYSGSESPHCNDFGEAARNKKSGTGCVIMSLAK